MKKYLRIWLSFVNYGLMWALEYRVNFLLWTLIGLMWSAAFVYSVDILFGQVQSIAGWTKNGVLLVTVTETMFVGALWLFVFPNLKIFSRLIRKGELDFYLIKPVNSRFLVSTRDFSPDSLIRVLLLLAFVFWFVVVNHMGASFSSAIGYIFLLVCGMVIFYNLYFALIITNFWLINVYNFLDFFHSVLDMGRYPIQIYTGFLGTMFVFLIPIAYTATFPVQALIGKLGYEMYLLAIFLVVITSIFSQWFWNFALKHYSSASS